MSSSNSFGAAHCLQINFTPLGARRFFGMPMSEFTDRMVTLDDMLGQRRHALVVKGSAKRSTGSNASTWWSNFVADPHQHRAERIAHRPDRLGL